MSFTILIHILFPFFRSNFFLKFSKQFYWHNSHAIHFTHLRCTIQYFTKKKKKKRTPHKVVQPLLLFSRSAMSDSLQTPRPAAHQASLSITISWSLFKLKSMESVMPSNHLILCHPLLIPPSIFPNIRVTSSESALRIRWPKYWSFSFGISPSNEYSGLIPFRIDWFDLLAVQGTLKSFL